MIAFGLLTTILPVVIIVFVIAVAVKNKERGEEYMFRHLYMYLVLFATLMMVIGGGISIFMATADLVSPPGYYQTYQDFKTNKQYEKEEGKGETLSEAELKAEYDLMVDDEMARQRNNAKNQLIKSLGFIIIPLPIFLFFNRMRKQGDPA
ncbi:hypothetical protein [Peribacillus alkalitolerans]|uniref:hypothetical protein n=1 Tax=Peribacillus alkalitolerans TaxID=1550385 RepID=UPI0013D8CD05|nr:hypothetical protein [Peribacillus alkalitolerans]